MKTVLAILLFILPVVGRCGSKMVIQEVFKDGRFGVVDNATMVEACILTVDDPSGGKDLKQQRYVEGPYKKMPEEVRTLIAWKLLEDGNYTWDAVSACWPTYNTRIRFVSGHRSVSVDICFGCSQLVVVESGVVVGAGYFTPGSDWVFKALATQFPGHPVIKQIEKRRKQAELTRLQIEMAKARDARKDRANQALEPTATAVTDRAAHAPRQP